jgi:CBS domain containing-hemolysin-like protein
MDLDDNFFGQNGNKVQTLAGLMLELSSNMPTESKPYPFNHLTLSVETKANHRIEKVRVIKQDEKAPVL